MEQKIVNYYVGLGYSQIKDRLFWGAGFLQVWVHLFTKATKGAWGLSVQEN